MLTNLYSVSYTHLDVYKRQELIDPQNNPYYEECWQEYHRLRGRYGVDPNNARIRVNTRACLLYTSRCV